jgi:hypothetical protein
VRAARVAGAEARRWWWLETGTRAHAYTHRPRAGVRNMRAPIEDQQLGGGTEICGTIKLKLTGGARAGAAAFAQAGGCGGSHAPHVHDPSAFTVCSGQFAGHNPCRPPPMQHPRCSPSRWTLSRWWTRGHVFPIQKKSYGQPAAACCEAIGLTYSSVAASVAASLGNIVLVVPKYKGGRGRRLELVRGAQRCTSSQLSLSTVCSDLIMDLIASGPAGADCEQGHILRYSILFNTPFA